MIVGERWLGAIVLAMFLAGCLGSYYAVRDPSSGAQY
jgi:hypothetical protein